MNSLFNFRDEKLLRQALPHSSYANENPGESHNERLEFLGDALLTFIAGDYLYQKYPDLAEDDLTRQRSEAIVAAYMSQSPVKIGDRAPKFYPLKSIGYSHHSR
jgi:ribonuclease-3